MKKFVVGCWLLVTGVVMAMGARAAELPAGYTAVDHIVAPRGAYVDTGYRPNQNTHVVMDVTVQGLNEYWFGCWDEAYNKGAFALGNDDRLGVYYAVGNDGGSVKSDKGVDGLVSKGRHAVEITPYSFLVDGVEWMAKGRQGDFRLLNNLYLFAQNRKGTPVPGEYQHDVVCHGCTISEGETPKRDFVPCVRMADAVAGFYDTVEGKFYGNLGSGTFGASDERLPLGRELTSGTYEITESFAFAAPMGESALKIADGATVTLNISAGVIVAVRGGDAVGTMGAGAGIEVPANATLKVTGAGKLVAYGGKAANGADGHAGQNGSASQVQGRFESGGGGWGGNGGGGAGAGIGGRGGVGGEGGASGPQVVGRDWSYTDIAGNPGKIGGNGGNGGTCGSVSVEDFVTVLAYGGAAGAADGAGGASGQWAWLEGGTYYFGGFGGGGGGSGARGGAAQDIGGGGGGGFGGSGGGSGGYLSRFKWNTFKAQPAWGVGGLGAANGAAGGATSGFLPAFHGVSGACGGSGSLMIANGAAVRAAEGRYSVGRLSETVEIVYDKGKLLWVSGGNSNNLSYSVVSNSTGRLGNGWHVVNGTVSRKQRILVSGAANLVLLHNSSLTVDCGGISRESEHAPGIEVCDDNSLCVFGTETGVLTAKGSYNGAGIGTARRGVDGVFNCNSCGSIAFYGGTVTAIGGQSAAGVGGGYKGAGGTVTINGGSVTAFGGGGRGHRRRLFRCGRIADAGSTGLQNRRQPLA